MKKKILIICILIILLAGCNKEKTIKVKNKEIISNEIPGSKEENEYIDNNPIKLALYIDKKKATNYKSPMTIYKDIVSLECYYTNDDSVIDGKFKDTFNHYYSNYQNIDSYKIGYYIKFNTSDGEISKYIYNPSDVESFFNYIQVYLYDDIHQNDGYYDHVTKEEYNDRVNGDIEVKVFSYLPKDIGKNNEYLGNSKYSVLINKAL